MPTYAINLICCGAGAFLAIACFFAGAFVMFRGKSSIEEGAEQTFIGGSRKGEVFTIPTKDGPDFPPEPSEKVKHVLKKNADFLKNLGGR